MSAVKQEKKPNKMQSTYSWDSFFGSTRSIHASGGFFGYTWQLTHWKKRGKYCTHTPKSKGRKGGGGGGFVLGYSSSLSVSYSVCSGVTLNTESILVFLNVSQFECVDMPQFYVRNVPFLYFFCLQRLTSSLFSLSFNALHLFISRRVFNSIWRWGAND